MAADDFREFIFSLGRAQVAAAQASHNARQPEIDRLKAVIKTLMPYAVPVDVDLHVDGCTCVYHAAAKAVGVTKSVTEPNNGKLGVYGEWCRDPDLCGPKGYCPRDPNCGD